MNFLIVDDRPIVQSGLRLMLENAFQDIHVDYAGDDESACKAVTSVFYDLVVITGHGGPSGWISLISKMRRDREKSLILIFLPLPDYHMCRLYFDMGVHGITTHQAHDEDLVTCIHSVLMLKVYIGKEVLTAMVEGERIHRLKTGSARLSKREMEIALFLIEGKSTSLIAKILQLSNPTVSTIKGRIFKKVGTTNVIELRSNILEFMDERMGVNLGVK